MLKDARWQNTYCGDTCFVYHLSVGNTLVELWHLMIRASKTLLSCTELQRGRFSTQFDLLAYEAKQDRYKLVFT